MHTLVLLTRVKQGSVLSPLLFCIYIDDMLLQLAKVGVGCSIGSKYVGVLAYASVIKCMWQKQSTISNKNTFSN